jgi:hypothetical protein
MTFEPESFDAITEIAIPADVWKGLREAKGYYPRRNELMVILTDARACIDRINATLS